MYCAPVEIIMDRAGSDRPVVEDHLVGPLFAVQAHNLARHHKLRSEFLRLGGRSSRQFLPGNSQRKSQVVLDLRAGPGLSARRVCVNHKGIQTFGSSVNSRRKPRRAQRPQ